MRLIQRRMENKRTIAVSDIHGCIDEFDELLKTIEYNKNSDRLILLGDLIDRGPDSVGVVKKAREMKLECLMGNHEHKFLKWLRSNKKFYENQLYSQYSSQLNDDDIDYIAKMPTYLKLENFIAVHAGLKPGISLSNQKKDDLLYLRFTDKDRNFISLKEVLKHGKEALGAYFWTEFWTGPESVVYGHHVHSYTDPCIEEVFPNVFCYGIDTGCCFGGKLSCLILETKEIVQVQAKEIYYQSKE